MTAGDKVPFMALSLQWEEIAADVKADFDRLFPASAFALGPYVEAFETAIAAYLGVRHAVAVNSGTSALHLSAIVAGIGRGDKVMVPAQSFVGTIWGLLYQGAEPVFCDVDPRTGTIDPAEIDRRMVPGVKAVIPVHLFGQPADLDGVGAAAAAHGLTVIEDVAQAIGATYGGRMTGSFGQTGCFSFYPGKNLGAAGEGGLVSTDDDAVAARLRSLRNHGQRERYVHDEIGFNYRMDGVQGAVLSHKLKRLDAWTADRRRLAARYGAELAGLPLALPEVVHGEPVWHLYVVRHPERDALRAHLTVRGIETGLHYPVPLHRQPCLDGFTIDRDGFPEADRWAREGLSLPLFNGMRDDQQARVIAAVRDFFTGGRG